MDILPRLRNRNIMIFCCGKMNKNTCYNCINNSIPEGKQIHSQTTARAFVVSTISLQQNTLINMYDKCGNCMDARKVFDKMTEPNVFSWNMILAAYRRHRLPQEVLTLFRQMQQTDVQSDQFTFSSILPVCASTGTIEYGMEIHKRIIENGFLSDIVVVNALIDMYAKCGSIRKARKSFDKMPQQNVISWNAIIAGYAQHGLVEEALETFKQMQLAGVKPDSATFASILTVCAKMGALEHGMEIHLRVVESRFLSDTIVANTLIAMYAKCGSIQKANGLFNKMPQRNVVSWNAIIAGYAQNWLTENALEIFKQMYLTGVKPNSATFASILTVCAKMGALEHGMEIHEKTMESGFFSDVVVVNTLIAMYAKCGSIQKAYKLFEKMPEPDVVSWSAIIAAYAQSGLVEKGLETFKKMHLAGVNPNSASFASILLACAKMEALEQGMEIHQKVIESGYLLDVVVVTALIDTYTKCRRIHKALRLFGKMPQRNVVSWNALIGGYAQNGLVENVFNIYKQMHLAGVNSDSSTFATVLPVCAKFGAFEQGYAMHGYRNDVLKLFEQMKHSGTNPDHVSIVCVLFACSHAGLVDEGCRYFNHMNDSYCIMPTVDHYVCMVDLLGRAGYLEDALNFIIKMPIKPNVVWMCLLAGCRSHKHIGLGEYTAAFLYELYPKIAAPYVLLSNIYAELGRWGDVQKLRTMMKDRQIKKTPGCSWIEVHKMVHAFCVGDRSHPQI
ncbi:pentatricopeptide repeat-containing protein At1g15510, chloroplastic isoform X2 [Cryptomeria japonica]|uniref:pentatricopeptide repeat-containing protein At1g15510, chloroplastic isoform X2 n=1 Tax=Cryptomeria japonica TaxID=3369 RepID=UPI0027D9EF9C|nr:pentatricopeptide repeat-containing protein At1g15510, chloroplastic isoform X2 [Cryptomeria japonica]